MKKYYLHDGQVQAGPFSIEELKQKNVHTVTPIWYEGLSNWTTAGKVEELAELFSATTPPPFATPPPIQNVVASTYTPVEYPEYQEKKRSSLTPILIVILLVCGAFAAYNFIDKNPKAPDAALEAVHEAVMTPEEKERAYPSNYLSASGQFRENFWGNKFSIEGNVRNTSTVTTYKDIVVRVDFLSETETVLSSVEHTIYEYFPAHSTQAFKLKVDKPSNCKSISLGIVSATVN
jgi:hypothetical protein